MLLFKGRDDEKMSKTNKMRNNKCFSVIEVIVIVILTGVVTGLTTGFFIFKSDSKYTYTNLTNNVALQEFLEVYASVMTDYYEDVDESALINSAIDGMFKYLGDDYSTYLSKEQSESLSSQLEGEYQGIGVQIDVDKQVVAVFDDSPAMNAGIKVGDIVVKVNGEDATEWDYTKVTSTIKSTTTGKVNLSLKRANETINVTVELKKLNVPSVSHEVIEENGKKIGYLYIETFSKTTADQVESALKKLEDEKIESLIVDVRNNAGGYLSAAEAISKLFLEKGKVIYSLESKSGTQTTKDNTGTKRDYDIVVLINKGSASASEILAAALKESYGATLVGETSYGKGKVQHTMDLSSGGMVKYTSSKWLTPKGDCIDGVGIKPDYEILADYSKQPTVDATNEEEYVNAWTEYSNYLKLISEEQYNKAVELLAN